MNGRPPVDNGKKVLFLPKLERIDHTELFIQSPPRMARIENLLKNPQLNLQQKPAQLKPLGVVPVLRQPEAISPVLSPPKLLSPEPARRPALLLPLARPEVLPPSQSVVVPPKPSDNRTIEQITHSKLTYMLQTKVLLQVSLREQKKWLAEEEEEFKALGKYLQKKSALERLNQLLPQRNRLLELKAEIAETQYELEALQSNRELQEFEKSQTFTNNARSQLQKRLIDMDLPYRVTSASKPPLYPKKPYQAPMSPPAKSAAQPPPNSLPVLQIDQQPKHDVITPKPFLRAHSRENRPKPVPVKKNMNHPSQGLFATPVRYQQPLKKNGHFLPQKLPVIDEAIPSFVCFDDMKKKRQYQPLPSVDEYQKFRR
jgi:hypothetical protein